MKKRMLFVFNLKAGKSLLKSKLAPIIDYFVSEGYEVIAHSTQQVGDAYDTIVNMEQNYDIIVCSGGDGTLDEVVTGMVEIKSDKPLGYIPAGSTNDFANSLKIPKDMLEAAKKVVGGRMHKCDVGVFNADTFVYVAAFGLFTDVSYQTSQELKNVFGHVAYLFEGVKRLHSIPSYNIKVTYDDNVIEGEFIYGMITNSVSVGGFKGVTGKNVKLNDGLFEVTLIRKPNNAEEFGEIVSTLLLEGTNEKYVHTFKINNLKIECDKNIPWTLDGEFGGECEKADISVLKQAIKIIK